MRRITNLERSIDRKFDRKMAKKINSAMDPMEQNFEEQMKGMGGGGGNGRRQNEHVMASGLNGASFKSSY